MRWRAIPVAVAVAVAVAAAGCASTSYVVEQPPLDAARARGDRRALVPAQLSGSGAPVFVEAGAVRDDGLGRAHIINRTIITGYVLLGVGAAHVAAAIPLFITDGNCHGVDSCGLGTVIGGIVAGFGVAWLVIGAAVALTGTYVRPHEWRRSPPRAARLGADGALHF
ncbi:MAG TPA: hypothetical protein VFF06_36865 [Polyangia bacterium]|nr:hypothetical protein [Polyangia bacterium]